MESRKKMLSPIAISCRLHIMHVSYMGTATQNNPGDSEMTTATRKHEELGRMSRYMYRELCGAFGRLVHEQDAELWQNQDGSVWIIYVEGCRPDALIDSLKNDMQIMNEWHEKQQQKERERLQGQPVWK